MHRALRAQVPRCISAERFAVRGRSHDLAIGLPAWWNWEAELTAHAEERFQERGLTEIDLRILLDRPPGSISPDPESGRYRVFTTYRRRSWVVIVEPDPRLKVLVIISVFPASEP